MALKTLTVPNISCEHCERTVTEALTPLEGVRQVRVDIPAKQVSVEFDEALVDVDRMKAVLADEEYPVEAVS